MSKKKRTAVIPEKVVELKEYEFQCVGCKKIHKMSPYAIAQTTMGIALIFTCNCWHKTQI